MAEEKIVMFKYKPTGHKVMPDCGPWRGIWKSLPWLVATSFMATFHPVGARAESAPIPLNTAPKLACANGSYESVPVYFLNLQSGTAENPSPIGQLLAGMVPNKGCGRILGTNIGGPRSVDIYGDEDGRKSLKRFLGSLDLPRERINMDLWAIQISSASSAQLSEVMSQVQRVVDQTREAMQETYREISRLSYKETIINPENKAVKQLSDYGFSGAIALPERDSPSNGLNAHQPPVLSLTQMLLRLNFAKNPTRDEDSKGNKNPLGNEESQFPMGNYDQAAWSICQFFAKDKAKDPKFILFNEFEGRELERYNIQRIFNDDGPRAYRRPFQGFMEEGLKQQFDTGTRQPTCGDGALQLDPKRVEDETKAWERRQAAIIKFAENYQKFRQSPTDYDPDALARSASILDGMTGRVVDAINRDIEAYFIRPALFKIRQIVGRNRGVEVAEVGRSTIAGINGQTVTMTSGTVSSFDVPTPLRLGEWLNQSKNYLGEQGSIPSVLPNLAMPGAASLGALFPSLSTSNLPLIQSLLSTLPSQNAVAMLAALSEEKVRWQSLSSGLDLKLTPIVLRDQTQAEIKVDLTIANPDTLDKTTGQPAATKIDYQPSNNTMRPLSRISKSIINTKVYVNTMDLFALSSFNNQTTVTGDRWYVPLIGTIWKGAFGDIPVVGGWFSFKRPPQNIQHQSIILTNTLIVPSAMGMASYFTNKNNTPTPNPGTPSSQGQQFQSPYPTPKSEQLNRGLY